MAARADAFPAAGVQPQINPWVIACTVMLATFMEVLDTSVANVALPHIAGSLSATTDEATWVLTAYLVANAIVLPMSGWFSSLFGRKRFYMTCVFLFTISSALCGLAPSLTWLIIFRIMQGLGGGALQPVSQAIMRESFPREKQGVAMAFYGMGVVFAPVIGPTLGGWITDNFSWHWIFLINIPVGALSLFLTSQLIHDPPYLQRIDLREGAKIDYIGFGLLTIGLGALEIALDEGQRDDWFSSNLIVTATIIGVAALVSVVIWELRHRHPVVDFRLLKERNFAISTSAMFALGFVLYGTTAALPLFLQGLLGYTATQSGMVLSPGGIVIMCLMPLVGTLVTKIQPRFMIAFGLFMMAAGMWIMTHWSLQIAFSNAVKARMVQSVVMAFLFVPINAVAFNFIAKDRISYATGIINLARNIGGSTGIATVTTVLARRMQFHQSVLVAHLTPSDGRYESALQGTAAMLQQHGVNGAAAMHTAQGMIYGMVQQQAAMLSYLDIFYMEAIISVSLIPLLLFMKNIQTKKGEVHVE